MPVRHPWRHKTNPLFNVIQPIEWEHVWVRQLTPDDSFAAEALEDIENIYFLPE